MDEQQWPSAYYILFFSFKYTHISKSDFVDVLNSSRLLEKLENLMEILEIFCKVQVM